MATKTRTNHNHRNITQLASTTGNFSEIGVTGLSAFSGQIQADFLREMRGKEGYKRFDEMRKNNPVVRGLLLSIEQPIRAVSWEFSSDLGDTDPRLELLNDARAGMSHSWNDHIIEVLTMLPFGFTPFELVYKRDDRGRVMWRKLAIRGQDTVHRWLFDDSGGLAGFIQQTTDYRLVNIPIEKLILYRTRVERNNPEGESILRAAWVPYYFAKHIQQIEAIGIERDLAGLPVMTLPEGADTADTTTSDLGKAKKVVRNVRNDEQAGIVKPYGWEFELLSTGGTRQFDTNEIVKRYESRMLISALAQFLMLGQDNVGSLALSSDQTDFFTMSVNSVADTIAETFTKYAIPRLLKLNGYDADGITLQHTPAGDVDVTKVADYLQKLGAWITPTAEDELWVRQLIGMPERTVEDIQAERDAEQARKDEARQAFLDRAAQSSAQMAAEMFQADAPDDEQRRKRERQWQRAFQQYFDEAKPRILKAAKEMRKGV